jgi:hypothetical protein
MDIFLITAAIVFSFAVSLGVGSSTMAIINFFVAIADGTIDPVERRMMGIVYRLLRICMVTIFFTLAILTAASSYKLGADALTALLAAQWTALLVLYANAILMTLRIMPSTVGPALQAGSWYMLGLLMTLIPLGLATFSYAQFLLCYAVLITLAISIVNGIMAILKAKRAPAPTTPA